MPLKCYFASDKWKKVNFHNYDLRPMYKKNFHLLLILLNALENIPLYPHHR